MPNPFLETVDSPFVNFRFEVVLTLQKPINGVSSPICNASFAECSGLTMNMQPHTITEGGANQQKSHLKSPVDHGQLSLNRGMTPNKHLWIWFNAASTPGINARADGTVTISNPDGSTASVYKLYDCLPISLDGPSLNASRGEIAIEAMTLTYAQLKLEGAEGGGAGGSVNFSGGFGVGVNASASVSAGLSVSGGPGLSASAGVSASAGFSI